MRLSPTTHTRPDAGSILIIVLWVAFGLVAVALYFSHSMIEEMRASDNVVAGMEAEQAIEGAAVYVSNVLSTLQLSNNVPPPDYFRANNVKVGNARFWLIGRDTNDLQTSAQGDAPIWGLVDEASKVNLNTATAAMLGNLPQMTSNTAAAMYDWGSTNLTISTDGAKSETYSTLPTPYLCKSSPYESVGELSMVYGLNMDLLFGEDANLNGILDPNENDGTTSPPYDNKDGILDPGVLEYVTVFTRGEGKSGSNGVQRVSVANSTALLSLIQSNFPNDYQTVRRIMQATTPSTQHNTTAATSAQHSTSISTSGGTHSTTSGQPVAASGAGGTTTVAFQSVLQFYIATGISEADFQAMEPYLMNPTTAGMINVNTATATALACLPGVGLNLAPQILTYRQSNPPQTHSISWFKTAINNDLSIATQAGPYITAYSYQYMADVAAVGHNGRGYRRVRFIFDMSSGIPLVVYRQDMTHLGWALGKKLHDDLLAQNLK